MKITATRKEDLIRQRDEYDAESKRLKDAEEAQEKKWHQDQRIAGDGIKEDVLRAIGADRSPLEIYIQVDPYGHYMNGGWSVRVRVNEGRKFDEGTALSWDWEASLNEDGSVHKESGSWSGLKAVTSEQIADLEESVRIMKILNNIDWGVVLSRSNPKYEDYIDEENSNALRDRKNNRPDFESQLFTADLEDAIESGAWVKMKGRPETDSYRGSSYGDYWVKIDKLTPKFAYVHIAYDASLARDVNYKGSDERISIEKLKRHIVQPIETM